MKRGPSKERKKPSRIDNLYESIKTLLSEDTAQKFYYKRVLWQYLKDNHGLDVPILVFEDIYKRLLNFKAISMERREP